MCCHDSSDDTCGWTQGTSQIEPGFALDSLANYGGPTETMALPAGSAAIGAIPPAACTDGQGHPLTTDQRGYPRPWPSDGNCDVGAYQYGSAAPPTPTSTPTATLTETATSTPTVTATDTPTATPPPSYHTYLPYVGPQYRQA